MGRMRMDGEGRLAEREGRRNGGAAGKKKNRAPLIFTQARAVPARLPCASAGQPHTRPLATQDRPARAGQARTALFFFIPPPPPSHRNSPLFFLPENTVLPSALHAAHRTGWSCEVAALGTAWPDGCTSQHLTWLSQAPATSRLATGLNARQEIESPGGEGTSKSLFGLWPGGAGGGAPKPVPKADIARRGVLGSVGGA